ncbi:GGDEF domain-containing protein [Roseomonas sp. CCTCC AB2023176]|uniref:GGDEF domain-containing protein n=1 Tax=Roseomonas sp. CCTCC AB2023176 TaxID=3342640 RepID=UPI0035E37485
MEASLQTIAAPAGAAPANGTGGGPGGGSVAFRDMAEHCVDLVMVTEADVGDDGPRIRYVNPAFTRLTGWRADEVVGRPVQLIEGPATDREALRAAYASLRRGESATVRLLNYGKGGTAFWTDWRASPLSDGPGRTEGLVFLGRDLTSDQRLSVELEQMIQRDPLTGLLNRREFLRRSALAFETRAPGRFCCAVLQIDGIADLLGARGGLPRDAVLIGIADLLSDNTRRKDPLGRFEESAFALCLPAQTPGEALGMTERLRAVVSAQPVSTPGGPVRVTCSIGLASARASDTAADVLDRAAEARRLASERGGNSVELIR